MASRRSPLMDEIYDQFLVCKICFEFYKRPKTLQCLHTFCMECLEQHKDAELERSYRYLLYSRAISCPICRKKTELPSGGVRRLPDNFLVANLGVVINKRLSDSKVALCEICKPEVPARKKQASCRCLDCSKLLCKKCVDLHRNTKVTQDHSIFDIEVEKDIECKVHKGETVRYYCEPCEMCICVVCTFIEHKGHEVSSFAEGMQKHSRSLDNIVDVCKDRIDMVKDQLDLIYKCETQIKDAEESIRDMAIETISDIRQQEKDTVQKMYDAYGDDTLDFIKEKEVLQDNLDNLQSTCNLTDIITKDRSMELLLLKKEIQEKLKNLLQRQIAQPPDNAMKEVKFIPGNVVFGYLSVKGGNGEKSDGVDESEDEDFNKPSTSCNDISRFAPIMNGKCSEVILKDSMSQTDPMTPEGKYTTVGDLLKQIHDQLTQTEVPQSSDRACSPIQLSSPLASPKSSCSTSTSTDVRQKNTNVQFTPTIRRKVQTDIVQTYDEGTLTENTPISSKCVNTIGTPSHERSTLTAMQESRSKGTDTKGLVLHDDSGTVTTEVHLATTGTETDYVHRLNKCSGTPQLSIKDKMCGTTKLIQHHRETMTGYIAKMDMGVTARIEGEDKAIGTKTIVTVHSSDGDGDIRTCDQSSETPWNDEHVEKCDNGTMYESSTQDGSTGTEPIGVTDRKTFTQWFNMVHKETETALVDQRDISVNTVPPQMKSRGLNTVPKPMSHKGIPVQQDFLPKKPRMDTQLSQTVMTFDTDMITANTNPCHKQTSTDVVGDIQVSQPPISQNTVSTTTNYNVQVHGGTTMSSLMYTSEISTSTTSLQVALGELPLSKDASTSVEAIIDAVEMSQVPLIQQKHPDRTVSTAEIAIGTDLHTPDNENGHIVSMMTHATSTPQLHMSHMTTSTEAIHKNEICTMTTPLDLVNQQTTMMHVMEVNDAAVSTVAPSTVDQGQDPVKLIMLHASTNTIPKSVTSRSIATTGPVTNTSGTSTNHNVQAHDRHTSTEVQATSDASTNMNISLKDQSTHTSVQTAEVGVLKRPHTLSRSVNTKRTKLVSTAMSTDKKDVVEQMVMTSISQGTRFIEFNDQSSSTIPTEMATQCVGTLHIETVQSATSMPAINMRDTMSSPIAFADTIDRGCSPIQFETTVERSCSPILAMTKEVSVHAISKTREAHTSTTKVKMVDTSSGSNQLKYADKQNSPIRNLISTRTKFTCTPHVTMSDRGGSPIPTDSKEMSTNTRIYEMADREASPLKIVTTDQGVMATAVMATKSAGTPQVVSIEQGTMMKKVRFSSKCTGMPHVTFAEKASLTPRIHQMHKNISTDNIQTRDQSTSMAVGVAEPYKDLVAPKKVVTCTRGTTTQTPPMQTKETSTPIQENIDRASSPVLTVKTAEKGVMASKAEMIETKENFQGVGRGKGSSRTLSDSPRPSLESIREDSESGSSSDEGSFKDALPDLPVFGSSPKFGSPRSSPRLSVYNHPLEGRPQMGLGFGMIGQRDKFWRSSPTLGTSHSRTNLSPTMGASMLYPETRPPPVPLCMPKTEAATSTRDVSKENRATSTTDIEKQDKAVCTVCTTPETVVMQGKMAECINKLKTVRQRLEQQPIYSTATNTKTSDNETESRPPIPSSPLLSFKSKSVGSNLHDGEYAPFDSPSLRRKPPMVFSSTSESPSEGSDQEQHQRSRSNKARKQRLEINQLLRSNSLPESPEPPSTSDTGSSSSPSTRSKIAHLPPKGEEKRADTAKKLIKDRPKSPKDRASTIKEQSKDRPRSPRERPKSARSADRPERPVIQRQHSHEGTRTLKDPPKEPVRTKREAKVSETGVKSNITTLKNKNMPPLIDRNASLIGLLSPRAQQKAKAKKVGGAKFDELHPLLPSSPRNTRRLSEGTAKLVGETPRQRRERLEQQLSFEDRKALTRQYFQDTRPASPATKPKLARPRSAKSALSKEIPPLAERPPKVPNSEK